AEQPGITDLSDSVIQRLERTLNLPAQAAGQGQVRFDTPGILPVNAVLGLLSAAGVKALSRVFPGRLAQTHVLTKRRNTARQRGIESRRSSLLSNCRVQRQKRVERSRVACERRANAKVD